MKKLIKIGLGLVMTRIYEIGANLYGTIQHPYLTWKRIINKGHWLSSVILLIIVASYFGIREPIRWGNISWQGIIIHQVSIQSIKLWASISLGSVIASILTYLGMVGWLTFLGKLWVKQFDFRKGYNKVFKVWIYSYLPTFLWFLFTAGLFTLLPPPRQTTSKGFLLTMVFLGVSSGLLIWKAMLYLLTLKTGLGMNNKQIFWSTVITMLMLLIFAQLMYWLNVFKIPFI